MVAPLQPPLRPSDAEILRAFAHYGYPAPSGRPVVVGLRRVEEEDAWNDVLGALGGGVSCFFRGTTDPGQAPREGRGRIATAPTGVARVLPGLHRDAFRWHFHHSDRKHPCLGQAGPMAHERFQSGAWVPQAPRVCGFNLHRARWDVGSIPDVVGDYSHGCAVIPDRAEHWHLPSRLSRCQCSASPARPGPQPSRHSASTTSSSTGAPTSRPPDADGSCLWGRFLRSFFSLSFFCRSP